MQSYIINNALLIERTAQDIFNLKIIKNKENDDNSNVIDEINNQLLLSYNILNYAFNANINSSNKSIESNINSIKEVYETQLKTKEEIIKNINIEYKNIYNSKLHEEINIIKHKFESDNEILLSKLQNEININSNMNNQKNIEIESIKKLYESQINNLQLTISAEKEKNDLITQNNFKFNDMKNSLDNELIISKYQSEINNLKNTIKIENSINQIQNTIDTKFNHINKFFKNDTNMESGILGENFIYNFLIEHIILSRGELKNVSGKGHAGDLYLKLNNLNCIIEAKNHTQAIKNQHINRFLKTDLLNETYNSGIFISLKADFVNSSNITHFEIKSIENKPVIFLDNFYKNKNDLIIAIKILEYLLHQQSINENNIDDYINIINDNLNAFTELKEINENYTKLIKKSDNIVEQQLKKIKTLLNINDYKFNCQTCDYGTNKKSDINRHSKTCK